MTNILWVIISVIIMLFTRCGGDEIGHWTMESYKDEFGAETGESYISSGFFENNASKPDDTTPPYYLKVFADQESVYLKLWKDDTEGDCYTPEKESKCMVHIFDEGLSPHTYEATMNEKGEIHIYNSSFLYFFQSIEEINITIVFVEKLGFGLPFTVPRSNFNSVYDKLTKTYSD